MDKETINAYNSDAESIARLHSILTPYRIYELIEQYFIKNGKTADIGCGIGRDTHWLNQQAFPTIGVDASEEMLKQAARLYPNNQFIRDELPELQVLASSHFQNILCSAVLMHLGFVA
jgi:trans-aconitate methyltransferase